MSDHMLSPSPTPNTDFQASPPNADEHDPSTSFRDLFNIYDQEKCGYITIDTFIRVTKDSIQSDSGDWLNNEKELEELVAILDPENEGKIYFANFVAGIQKVTEPPSIVDEPLVDLSVDNSGNELLKSQAKSNTQSDDSIGFNDELLLVDLKSSVSPLSSSNNTFNEYDTDSQLHTNHSETNGRDAMPSSNQSHSNHSDMVDTHFLIDDYLSLTNTNTNHNLNSNQDATNATTTTNNNNNNNNNPFGDFINLTVSNTNTDKIVAEEIVNDDDPFGLGSFSEHNSLSFSSNDLSATKAHKASYMNSKRAAKGLYTNSNKNSSSNLNNTELMSMNFNNDSLNMRRASSINDGSEHDHAIEKLEGTISELNTQNEYLNSENTEIVNKMSKILKENTELHDKIRELEENSLETEKKYTSKLNEMRSKNQDSISKLTTSLEQERENHTNQMNNTEKEMKRSREECSKYLKEIADLNKKLALIDEKLSDETDKSIKISKEHQILLKEKENIVKEANIANAQNKEHIESLSKELETVQLNLRRETQKQRGFTISLNEDSYFANKIKELEAELNQAKLTNIQLNSTVEELNAQIFKNNVEGGRVLLHLTASSGPSLAAEIDTMSKDELMEKLRHEQQVTKRLREYVDQILSKIMSRNPELLEVSLNATATTPAGANVSALNGVMKFSKRPSINRDTLGKMSYSKSIDSFKSKF